MLAGQFEVIVIISSMEVRHHLHKMDFIFFVVTTSHGVQFFNL